MGMEPSKRSFVNISLSQSTLTAVEDKHAEPRDAGNVSNEANMFLKNYNHFFQTSVKCDVLF